MTRAPDHPIAPPSGYVSVARLALYEKIGPGPHPCHWCGESVDWVVGVKGNHNLVADHVDGDELNDDSDNIVASCGPCNGVRARAVNDDEVFFVRANGTRLRGHRALCARCGRDFVSAQGATYCSKSCARRTKSAIGPPM